MTAVSLIPFLRLTLLRTGCLPLTSGGSWQPAITCFPTFYSMEPVIAHFYLLALLVLFLTDYGMRPSLNLLSAWSSS